MFDFLVYICVLCRCLFIFFFRLELCKVLGFLVRRVSFVFVLFFVWWEGGSWGDILIFCDEFVLEIGVGVLRVGGGEFFRGVEI